MASEDNGDYDDNDNNEEDNDDDATPHIDWRLLIPGPEEEEEVSVENLPEPGDTVVSVRRPKTPAPHKTTYTLYNDSIKAPGITLKGRVRADKNNDYREFLRRRENGEEEGKKQVDTVNFANADKKEKTGSRRKTSSVTARAKKVPFLSPLRDSHILNEPDFGIHRTVQKASIM